MLSLTMLMLHVIVMLGSVHMLRLRVEAQGVGISCWLIVRRLIMLLLTVKCF